jgi:hypothetical protein
VLAELAELGEAKPWRPKEFKRNKHEERKDVKLDAGSDGTEV